MLGEQPLETILEQVVHIAKKVLPTPVEASITLVADDQPFTVAFTDQTAVELAERRYETERGPCLDAAASGQVTGALNFYATEAAAFSEETVELARTFAAHAAVAEQRSTIDAAARPFDASTSIRRTSITARETGTDAQRAPPASVP